MSNALEKQAQQPLLKVRLNYADFVSVDEEVLTPHRHHLRIFAYDILNKAAEGPAAPTLPHDAVASSN